MFEQGQDRVEHLFAYRHGADELLQVEDFLRAQHRLGSRILRTGRRQKDGAFLILFRIGHVDLHQEAIELGFGQRIGAFLLDRVLGRQHVEGLGQIMALARHGDKALLHGLQQGGLGAWAGAVDLVRHQKATEDRAGNEAEMAFALGVLVEHFGPQNIRRHQVGRELDPLVLKPGDDRQRMHQSGLRHARRADQQAMAARQDHGQ